MRKTILTTMAAGLLLIVATAFAQPGPGGPPPGNMPGPNGGLVAFLGLDDAQLEAWTAFHDEFRATVEPLHEAQADLRAQLRDALDSGTADATTIGQLVLNMEAIRAKIMAARDQLDANLKSLLTADQLLKFEAFRAAQAEMRRGGGGPGGGPGQGPGNGGPGKGPGAGTCTGPCN